MKKRVSVQLDGRSYVVITEDDEEYVKGIAAEVSENLLKASRSAKNLDVRDCAILVALDFCKLRGSMTEDARKEESYRITTEFFKKIPMIREYIETDLLATLDGDPAAANFDEVILAYPADDIYPFILRQVHFQYLDLS